MFEKHPLDVETTTADWRVELSAQRLLDARYEPRAALDYDLADRWPGDFTGRLLAAQLALEGVRPALGARADVLADLVLSSLGPDGVLGPPVGDIVDEQQVSGHGWLVAALLAWARARGRADVRDAALRMADAVLLPALSRLDDYPIDADRDASGAASGHRLPPVGRWMLSTDTFCVLIGLEGLVAAYLETGDERYRGAIDEAARFLRDVDLVGRGAQLHASLTAARCLLAAGRRDDRQDLIGLAARVYGDWAGRARTLDHQTWNWFGRPDSWTEPCAVVDALELAWSLWEVTGRREFLEDAEIIRHSGLAFAQNGEGGFSLSSIATAESPTLSVLEHDAYWCCTMRGAWGLARQRHRGVRAEEVDGRVLVTVDSVGAGIVDVAAADGPVVLRFEADYPDAGILRVTSLEGAGVEIAVTSKPWSPAAVATIARGGSADIPIDVLEWRRPVGEREARYRGPRLLGRTVSGEWSPVADRTLRDDAPRSVLG